MKRWGWIAILAVVWGTEPSSSRAQSSEAGGMPVRQVMPARMPPPIPGGAPLEIPADSQTRPELPPVPEIPPPLPRGRVLEVIPNPGPLERAWETIRPAGARQTAPGHAVLESGPSWLDDNDEVQQAGHLHHHGQEGFVIPRPPHPTPPPATWHGSQCDFNPWCGSNVFSPDFTSYQVLGGYFASSDIGPRIPDFTDVTFTVRKGWMLTANDECGYYLDGNWEVLAGLSAGGITSDYGTYLVSPTVHVRRNFLSLGTTVVPYVQVGAGFFITDANKDKTQRAIGQMCSFTGQAHLGCRFFIMPDCSLDVEFGYRHVSNLNSSERNYGVNSLGAQIGLTYHLPWGH